MSRVPIIDHHFLLPSHIQESTVVTPNGPQVVRYETAFAPAPVHYAIDTETGQVYAGRSPDEAVFGIGYDRAAKEAEAAQPARPTIEHDPFVMVPVAPQEDDQDNSTPDEGTS